MAVAIVTGANRGLGRGVSEELANRGFTVIMTARNPATLREAQSHLQEQGHEVFTLGLDVSDPKSIELAVKRIVAEFEDISILVNNAGISRDGLDRDIKDLNKTMIESFQTNTIGPTLLIQGFLPTMKKQNYGRIVNVSSGMGGLTEMEGGYLAYRTSKVALNAVTRVYANEVKGKDILINSVCPGWVRTDMGGPNATRELSMGVESILWAAFLPKDGPTGGFFRDGKQLAW